MPFVSQKMEAQHAKLRKHGMICPECGERKSYEDFPVHGRTGRITVGKPCLACTGPIMPKGYRRASDPTSLFRVCPACLKQRNPAKFHPTGLCHVCFEEQKKLVASLSKRCPVCQNEQELSEYDKGKNYCKKCATILAVHTCGVCNKGFQLPEMVFNNSTCVYCAFARGSEEDLIELRALVRTDKLSAIKLREFIDSLTRS